MSAVVESPSDGPFCVVRLGWAWDPAWLQHVASHPGLVLTQNGVPALAHLTDAGQQAVVDVIKEQSPLQAVDGLNIQPIETAGSIENKELRKQIGRASCRERVCQYV